MATSTSTTTELRTCTIALTAIQGYKWRYGELRGGTPALLVRGEYLTFFHSKRRVHGRRMTYFVGAYTFQSDFPFGITSISKHPIVADTFYIGKLAPQPYDYILYPTSFIYMNHSSSCSRSGSGVGRGKEKLVKSTSEARRRKGEDDVGVGSRRGSFSAGDERTWTPGSSDSQESNLSKKNRVSSSTVGDINGYKVSSTSKSQQSNTSNSCDEIYLFYGRQDEEVWMAVLDVESLLSSLVTVNSTSIEILSFLDD